MIILVPLVCVPFTRGRCCAVWGKGYACLISMPASPSGGESNHACSFIEGMRAIDRSGTSLHVGCSCHAPLSPRPLARHRHRELKISFRTWVETLARAATLSHAAQIGHMLALHKKLARWQHHLEAEHLLAHATAIGCQLRLSQSLMCLRVIHSKYAVMLVLARTSVLHKQTVFFRQWQVLRS